MEIVFLLLPSPKTCLSLKQLDHIIKELIDYHGSVSDFLGIINGYEAHL
jgi:hypothetical protein